MEVRAGVEFRVAGRTLSGRALVYGDVAPQFAERFEFGAELAAPALNLQHDPSMVVVPAGGYVVTDTRRALELRAVLRAESAALKLVKRGALNGFSIEFNARAERREAGIRVIERADLTGIALVDQGAYPASTAEVRAERRESMSADLPTDADVDCECLGTDACSVHFPADVMEAGLEEAFTRETGVIAVAGNYSAALASTKRGTLRRDGNRIEIDLPATDSARNLMQTNASAGVILRPIIDKDASEWTAENNVARMSKLRIRAFTIGATDKAGGWPEPDIRSAVRESRAKTKPRPRYHF